MGRAYRLGLLKTAEMRKEATSLLRLLSRVGPNLDGASPRALKWLAKRGITSGFTPAQSRKLIRDGQLPGIDTVLRGDDIGSMRMIATDPKSIHPDISIPSARVRRIFRADNASVNYDGSGNPVVSIPYRFIGRGDLLRRLSNANTIRHEAREFIRMLGRAKRLNTTEKPITPANKLGIASHNTGVLYDERVYASGLTNRLGLDIPWAQFPISIGGKSFHPRSFRELSVGYMPHNYEHDIIRRLDDNSPFVPMTERDRRYYDLKRVLDMDGRYTLYPRTGKYRKVVGDALMHRLEGSR